MFPGHGMRGKSSATDDNSVPGERRARFFGKPRPENGTRRSHQGKNKRQTEGNTNQLFHTWDAILQQMCQRTQWAFLSKPELQKRYEGGLPASGENILIGSGASLFDCALTKFG